MEVYGSGTELHLQEDNAIPLVQLRKHALHSLTVVGRKLVKKYEKLKTLFRTY